MCGWDDWLCPPSLLAELCLAELRATDLADLCDAADLDRPVAFSSTIIVPSPSPPGFEVGDASSALLASS